MHVEGYVACRIERDKLTEILRREMPRYDWKLTPDEDRQIVAAFNKHDLHPNPSFRFIDDLNISTPIIFRTPYVIQEEPDKVTATNLHTGKQTSARRILLEIDGFSEPGFTLADTEGVVPIRYQIEKGIGPLQLFPPPSDDLEVKVLEPRVKEIPDGVIYFDNLMVPLHLVKTSSRSTRKETYDYTCTVNGGVIIDGCLGRVLETYYSNVSDMKWAGRESPAAINRRRVLFAGIGLLLAGGGATAYFVDSQYKNEKRQKAKNFMLNAYKLNNPDFLRQAIELCGDDPKFCIILGDKFYRNGNISMAYKYYRKAETNGYHNQFLLEQLGRCCAIFSFRFTYVEIPRKQALNWLDCVVGADYQVGDKFYRITNFSVDDSRWASGALEYFKRLHEGKPRNWSTSTESYAELVTSIQRPNLGSFKKIFGRECLTNYLLRGTNWQHANYW
jgi:hypothetical protein